MNVLIVNTSDIQGGAAKAAYRLHSSLIDAGINSQMLVRSKLGQDDLVIGPSNNIQKNMAKLRLVLDRFPLRFYPHRSNTLFSPLWLPFSKMVDQINRLKPDIVHLHWIGFGMMRIEDIARIEAPIVWSLHDMWPFTGGCHYDEACEGYKGRCGHCKVLGSQQQNDLSRSVFRRKEKSYAQIKSLTVIGLSRWLADCANKSTLFHRRKIVNLPNPIDTTFYKPCDKTEARALWNLPSDKKLVLFGAVEATNDPRKGFKELRDALQQLAADDVELVVFGGTKPKESRQFGFKTHYLGHLHDEISLITLYSAADVMVVPSLQENLSNAIMESLSCGTPVVAFQIGGNGDMIEHQTNGYLAKAFDTVDLAKGVEWVLRNPQYQHLCTNARNTITKAFDSKIVAEQYISLYNDILHAD